MFRDDGSVERSVGTGLDPLLDHSTFLIPD